MIFTYKDFISELLKEFHKHPKKVWVSTFNFHIGISSTGNVYDRSDTFRLVREMNEGTSGSRILIGTPLIPTPDFSRKMQNTAEYFDTIQFRHNTNMHLKCWIFFHQKTAARAMVGGRNLGDSEWADVNLWIDPQQTRRLIGFFDSIWLNSQPIVRTSLRLK